MIIQTFDDLYDATQVIEVEAEQAYRNQSYFKAQLYRTWDGRWRVGIITEDQMELDV